MPHEFIGANGRRQVKPFTGHVNVRRRDARREAEAHGQVVTRAYVRDVEAGAEEVDDFLYGNSAPQVLPQDRARVLKRYQHLLDEYDSPFYREDMARARAMDAMLAQVLDEQEAARARYEGDWDELMSSPAYARYRGL